MYKGHWIHRLLYFEFVELTLFILQNGNKKRSVPLLLAHLSLASQQTETRESIKIVIKIFLSLDILFLCVLYSCDHCFFYYVQTCPKLCLKRMSPVRYRAHYSHNLNSIYSPIFRRYFIMLQPPAKNYNKGLY